MWKKRTAAMFSAYILVLIFVNNIRGNGQNTGLCGDNICCAGYRKIDGNCEACPTGTTGYYCNITCKSGYYGRLCRGECSCLENEVCDSRDGCIHNKTTQVLSTDSPHHNKVWNILWKVIAIVLCVLLLLCLSLIFWCLKNRKPHFVTKNERRITAETPDKGNRCQSTAIANTNELCNSEYVEISELYNFDQDDNIQSTNQYHKLGKPKVQYSTDRPCETNEWHTRSTISAKCQTENNELSRHRPMFYTLPVHGDHMTTCYHSKSKGSDENGQNSEITRKLRAERSYSLAIAVFEDD